jgi:3-hydroxybutyryl-CoA dehydrogenase
MVERLGVVGFGTMGSEIALLGACAGMQVTVHDPLPGAIDSGMKRLAKVARVLSRDERAFGAQALVDDAARAATLQRIGVANDLAGLAGCQCVIEAAPERIELKRHVFGELSSRCTPDALLATNTSGISITEVAFSAVHPERVVGMHFFNPPSAMQLVEVVPGLPTAEEAVARALELAKALGKKGIRVKETPGFIVNRVLTAMMNEAITLLEEGVAGIEDIDEAMRLGAGFPLGPFKLCDLVGLDVYLHTCESIHKELGRDKFRPPFKLAQYVRAGRLGRKTKLGFYKY